MKKTHFLSIFLLFVSFSPGSYSDELELDPGVIEGCRTTVSPPPANTQVAADATKVLPPAHGIYPGLYNIGSTRQSYNDFKTQTGKAPPIVYTFHDFVAPNELNAANPTVRTFTEKLEGDDAPSPLTLADEISQDGSVLALSWAIECCDMESMSLWYNLTKPNDIVPRLIQGDFDAEIRAAARQIKNFGRPIMLALFGEYHPQSWFLFGADGRTQINNTDNICNKYGDPTWPDGPERVRDTYIHVIDLFRLEGVKNVTWFMYTSTRYMDPTDDDFTPWMHPKYFYPGDNYIDWVGQSAYFVDMSNRPAVNEEVQDIVKALKPGYDAWGTVTQRPFIIPEFASPSDSSHSRADILREVVTNYLPSLPRVKAFTFANGELFENYFEIPLFGKLPDEVNMWKTSVVNNPNFVYTINYQ